MAENVNYGIEQAAVIVLSMADEPGLSHDLVARVAERIRSLKS